MTKLKARINALLVAAKEHFVDPVKRVALIKNAVVLLFVFTIGLVVSPNKAIGVLITKMPCADHPDCIVTTIREFDI